MSLVGHEGFADEVELFALRAETCYYVAEYVLAGGRAAAVCAQPLPYGRKRATRFGGGKIKEGMKPSRSPRHRQTGEHEVTPLRENRGVRYSSH